MSEINLRAARVERRTLAERHTFGLVETLMRSVRHAFIQHRDLQAAAMHDEIDERLREQLAALAHGVEFLGILARRLVELPRVEDFSSGDEEAVAEQS